MREILFRGKNVDNGFWEKGHLYITHLGEYEISRYEPMIEVERFTRIVIPETVGQYTGLTDKNGQKIFEGDIVKVEAEMGSPFFDDVVGKIVYEECAFFIEPKNPAESIYLFDECAEHEVIGNIHDNPELLGGAE